MFRFLWSNRMSEFPSQRLLLTRNDNKKLGEICTTYWCIACVAVAFLIRHSTVCWVRMRIKFSSRTDDVVVQGEVSCVSSGEVSQFLRVALGSLNMSTTSSLRHFVVKSEVPRVSSTRRGIWIFVHESGLKETFLHLCGLIESCVVMFLRFSRFSFMQLILAEYFL